MSIFNDIGIEEIALAVVITAVFVVVAIVDLFSHKAECKPLRYVCYGDLTYENGAAICEAKTTGDAAGGGG